MKRKIFAIITVISILFLLGTLGAADCEQINIRTLLIRSTIGLIVMGGGVIGLSMYNVK